MSEINLVSWNVNGIRAILKKNFMEFVNKEQPDILCLQETKAHPDQVDIALHDYLYHYWNAAEKKGYSGTAIFSKIKPISVNKGMGIEEHDKEGRIITLEFENFYLINVYTPNAKHELLRLDYRQKWDADFLKFMKKLEQKKPVVVCGDLNVAHQEIDLKNPKTNRRNPGFTDEERQGMTNFLENGYVDTFRHFYPEKIQYSWWSYRGNARKNNTGWRIDYFLASKALESNLVDAQILDQVLGSDHCPVVLKLNK
jgi:exodeoxyribonuclease-3